MDKIKIISEGVLVLASSEGLKEEYKNKEFDYNFPNGIQNLLNSNQVIAINTLDGDDLLIEIIKDKELPFSKLGH